MKKPSTPTIAADRILNVERLIGLGFWEWDHVAAQLTYCSEGYAAILDSTPEQVIAAMATDEKARYFIHPDDVEVYFEKENAAYKRGEGIDIEYRALTAAGKLRHLHEVCELKLDADGKVISSFGVVQDITARKQIEEQLSRTLADARLAEQVAQMGTYEWDWVAGRLVACSEAYASMFQMTVEEAIEYFCDAETDHNAVHADDLARVLAVEDAAVKAMENGYDVQYRQSIPSGGYLHVRERCVLERDAEGAMLRSMGSIQDITDRVHLEDQLRQVQKLEAISQLGGGIAHDFNNMLMVVSGNLELAKDLLEPDHPSLEMLNSAADAVERGATLTRRLLAFSRKQSLHVHTVDLAKLLGGMKELLQPSLGETVRINIPPVAGEWLCKTDPAQLENAILNLAINARDAMPDGGSLLLGLKRVVLDQAYCANFDKLNPGNYIRLVISDDGTGMSAEVLNRAFEPFFTTKDVGEGTGLGLSMVYGFMKQTGGHVLVYSETGVGTEIKLFLPDAMGDALEINSKGDTSEPAGHNETVLVVEDEAEVRKLTVSMLKGLGYKTLEAETVSSALALLDERAEIDLIFSDVVLPGGSSGLDLAARVGEIYPAIKVLLASGYNPDAKMLGDNLHHVLLEKPYSRAMLAQTLRQVLD